MAANSTFTVVNSYSNTLNTGTGGTLTDSFADSPNYAFANGILANQIDLPWSASNNATTTYTLSALPGPGTATTDLVKVRKFFIHNTATADGNTVAVTPAVTHGWVAAFGSGGVTIPAGGMAAFVAPSLAGYPVVASTTDAFTVTVTGTVVYKISIEGASA